MNLFDAINNNLCRSYEDIAVITGWSKTKTASEIAKQRRLATEGKSWWTIPHQARGRGDHLFFAVTTDGGTILSDLHKAYVLDGLISTLKHVVTMNDNESRVLTLMANHVVEESLRQALLSVASALTEAATIADEASVLV